MDKRMTSALPEVLEKLENCPFCGGEAHLERQGHVACKTGWPCVHTAYFNSGTPEEQNAAAIRAWNTRPALLRDAGDGWLPVESAPRDGRAVILAHMGGKPYIGNWFHDTWMDERGLSRGPSHWRPLPQPPAMHAPGGSD